MTALIGAFLGAAVGGGAFAAVLGWRGVVVSSNSRSPKSPEYPRRGPDKLPLRLFLALAGCAAAVGLTGWPVAGVLGAIGGFAAPTIVGAKASRGREIDEMQAIATWVEMVRDTVGAASGLAETLKATAVTAPAGLQAHVRRLAARAEREPLPEALIKFAKEANHAIADTVAITLVLATTSQVGSVQESLAELAENTRQEVSMRLRIEASRARQFTSARFIAGVVAVFSIGMVALSRAYLAPFDTASGQVVLTVIGGLFIGSGIALVRMSSFDSPPRILDLAPASAHLDNPKGFQQ